MRSILLPPLSPPRPPIVTLLHANPLLRLSAAQSLVALMQELTLPLGSPLESSADMEVQVEFHPFDEPSARTLVESATADVDMLVGAVHGGHTQTHTHTQREREREAHRACRYCLR